MAQTCALIAPVQPVLHRVSCSNKTLTNAPKHYENTPKHEFRVQWGGSRAFVAKNSMRFRTTNFCIYVQPVLHHVLCSNETNPKCTQTVRNTPILKFRVQWGGSGMFVAKKLQCDFMTQTCALIAPVQPILHRVPCSNDTLPNAPKH